jgi:tripartite-type tricarboxylate transporter receptor subunit TctC
MEVEMICSRRVCLSAALLLAAGTHLGVASTRAAAQSFPNKAVHIVVPFAPGTAPDVIARLLAENLQPKWQQPIVVENRVGASGNVGAEYVAHAEPDGHTLLLSPPPPLAINRFLFKSLPFQPSDLAIVTVLASAPNVLVAKLGVPASNVAELIALARTAPVKLSYASTGKGGTPHLTMEWVRSATGLELAHVPYPKGLAPALNDLIGGHVDLMFANLSDAKPHVEGGKLKALAVTSADPDGRLPGVPPISRDIPGLVAETWFALAAPGRTPAATVTTISADVASALKSAAVSDRLLTLSLTPVGNAPKDASTFVEADAKRWQNVIEKIGLTAQ